MEKCIHISPIYYRNSIFKNGLIPSKIPLDHHLEGFREDNLLSNDENKMLYMWLSSEKDNKFIKDMVYCKAWIEPRNKLWKLKGYNFINPQTNLYAYDQMIFDIYEISNFSEAKAEYRYLHAQEDYGSKYNSLYQMDDRYTHNDKELVLSKTVEKNFKIIKQAYMSINKKGKINVKIK